MKILISLLNAFILADIPTVPIFSNCSYFNIPVLSNLDRELGNLESSLFISTNSGSKLFRIVFSLSASSLLNGKGLYPVRIKPFARRLPHHSWKKLITGVLSLPNTELPSWYATSVHIALRSPVCMAIRSSSCARVRDKRTFSVRE